MTDIKQIIDKLKELDGARTKGEYTVIEHECSRTGAHQAKPFYRIVLSEKGRVDWDTKHPNDMVFAANSANAVPRLIEHIEGLEKELQESANRIFNAKIEADKALSYCKYDETPFNHLKTIRDYLDAASPPPQKRIQNDKV